MKSEFANNGLGFRVLRESDQQKAENALPAKARSAKPAVMRVRGMPTGHPIGGLVARSSQRALRSLIFHSVKQDFAHYAWHGFVIEFVAADP